MAIRLLIVEDEVVIAKDLQRNITKWGYQVVGIATSSEEAIRFAADLHPDLLLMDIRLNGELDGIETAARIYEQLNLPVIYLTAHMDEDTLNRAKITRPLGYLMKPVDYPALRASIELAFHTYTVRKQLIESELTYKTILNTTLDGFMVVDDHLNFLDVNEAFCEMTGYTREEILRFSLRDLWDSVALTEIEHQEKLIGGGSDRFEVSCRRKDSTLIDLDASVAYVKENQIFAFVRDITERKQAEEALRTSKDRYHSLFDSVPVGLYRTAPSGQILDINLAGARMLGYDDYEDIFARSATDFWVNPEERNQLGSLVGQEGTFNLEVQMWRRDQKNIWVHNRGRAVRDDQGQILYYEGSLEDITERKQVEENLARQVERLRALHTIDQAVISSMDLNKVLELLVREIVEQLQVDATAVLLLNPQTQTLDFAASQGFRTEALKFTSLNIGTGLAGEAAQESKTVYVANLAEMDNNPILSQSIAKEEFVTYFGIPLIAKGQMRGVLEIFHRSALTPDPNWITFLETIAGQAAISIDNAHLLEMTQESLKETNALYRINQDLVATIDAGQLMKNVVNLLQENFGYYYVQIYVADPETGDFVVRAGSGKIGEQLVRKGHRLAAGEGIVGYTAETGAPFFTNDVNESISFVRNPLLPETQSELAVPIKTGAQFLGLIDIQQVPPAYLGERDVQLVSAVADQLAVALQKAQLYVDLQNSLRQEQTTRSQLVQNEKLTVAGRLLASVSHELNNPIQAIQNALFLLKEEQGISIQGKQDLEIVLSETDRMASMLQRLRTSYQPVNSEDFKPVRINGIIEDVCALVATHLRHSHISFEFYADSNLPPVSGLDSQIRQVILNLFMNAVDAMTDGGRLIIATQFLADSREALITVSDTGPGIEENIMPNIFDAFVTNKERGTGLGLAISQEIILKHYGRIQAKNNPARGATISVWLPVDPRGDE